MTIICKKITKVKKNNVTETPPKNIFYCRKLPTIIFMRNIYNIVYFYGAPDFFARLVFSWPNRNLKTFIPASHEYLQFQNHSYSYSITIPEGDKIKTPIFRKHPRAIWI